MSWRPHVTTEALRLAIPGSEVMFRSEASIGLIAPSVTLQQLQSVSVLADTPEVEVTPNPESGGVWITIRPPEFRRL